MIKYFSWQQESPLSIFTKRERDVLRLLLLGYTIPQIADELSISARTAETHYKNIRRKLGIGAGERYQLVAWAIENGLVEVKL